MNQEFETQVLNVDVEEIKQKLRDQGAKEEPEVLMRRWTLDMNPDEAEWIRLREAGDKTTVCYKCKNGSGIADTTEIETEVSDFEAMAQILTKLNFAGKYYQENKKQVFTLDGIEFALCYWPLIPAGLEIEAKSETEVQRGLKMLGLEGKDVGHPGWKKIYEEQYGIDIHSYKELKFDTQKEKA